MLYDKRMLYETDIRVPLFVSGPGIKAGQTIESPAGHIDLAPTILSMAGIATPPQMDGRSWLPLVFGGLEEEGGAASQSQVEAAAGWRHTFMVEYSGGGTPVDAELEAVDAVQIEATFEDKHWYHSMSFQRDVVAGGDATDSSSSSSSSSSLYPPYFNSSCGASASDELSIWGKCSCTATFGSSTLVHDQSPCDSVRRISSEPNCTATVALSGCGPQQSFFPLLAFQRCCMSNLSDSRACNRRTTRTRASAHVSKPCDRSWRHASRLSAARHSI